MAECRIQFGFKDWRRFSYTLTASDLLRVSCLDPRQVCKAMDQDSCILVLVANLVERDFQLPNKMKQIMIYIKDKNEYLQLFYSDA